MTRQGRPAHLPLLYSGLTRLLVDRLRMAGLPVTPFRLEASMSRRAARHSGKFLLFDVRSASGRVDAQSARQCGIATIELSSLWKDGIKRNRTFDRAGPAGQRHEAPRGPADFFDRLKEQIELAGGFWLRLGDYPFPYQSMLVRRSGPAEGPAFLDGFDRRAAPQKRADNPDEQAGADLRKRLLCGLPVVVSRSREEGFGSTESALQEADQLPLVWRATAPEFERWWKTRQCLRVVACREGNSYHIRCEGDFGGYCPTVELWVGNHVASLPLLSGGMAVREDGIVFVHEMCRHPAGFSPFCVTETDRDSMKRVCQGA